MDSINDALKQMLRKYLDYCLPLMPYAWISCAYEFTDRWLLQNYGGSVEQAYYAVGSQFAAIALIATSSILHIFWKEIAEAHHQGNHVRTGMLYQKVSRLLFLVGAMIGGLLIPWEEGLLHLILGAAYVGGATTLAIMFLYPIHHSMGQISGTMLYATEWVSIQVIIGIVFMIVSMGVSYLVLAPGDAVVPGLGLALKIAVLQIIQVNIIAHIWKRPFDWTYQPASLLSCVGLGWGIQYTVTGFVSQVWSLIVVMGLGGVLYLMLMVAFMYTMPWLAGMTREDLFWMRARYCRK